MEWGVSPALPPLLQLELQAGLPVPLKQQSNQETLQLIPQTNRA